MIPIKAGAILDQARFFLNDTQGAVFTNEVLMPALIAANTDLQLECQDNDIPFNNRTSVAITVPAGIKDIGGSTGPALPADLVEIVEMYERVGGTDNDYLLMSRRNFLPKTEQESNYLQVYSWQGQEIKLLGATTDIQVKIDYIGYAPAQIVDENSLIILYNAMSFLWFRTAAHAAEFIGEDKERAVSLNQQAVRCIETMENIQIKHAQSVPIRRRPFMSSYKQKGWSGSNW